MEENLLQLGTPINHVIHFNRNTGNMKSNNLAYFMQHETLSSIMFNCM